MRSPAPANTHNRRSASSLAYQRNCSRRTQLEPAAHAQDENRIRFTRQYELCLRFEVDRLDVDHLLATCK